MKKIIYSIVYLIVYIFDRLTPIIEKASGEIFLKKIVNRGKNCRVEGKGRLIDSHRLYMGDEVFLGRNCFIRATGIVTIGSYTHISRNVVIHTVNHNTNGDLLPYDRTEITKPIKIGRFVWIGMNVNILPGVEIGDGAIIGMGTTVSKDVAPGEILVGSSSRVIGSRDEDKMMDLDCKKKYLTTGNKS